MTLKHLLNYYVLFWFVYVIIYLWNSINLVHLSISRQIIYLMGRGNYVLTNLLSVNIKVEWPSVSWTINLKPVV